MTDIVAFARARLDEDEAIAQSAAAGQPDWHVEHHRCFDYCGSPCTFAAECAAGECYHCVVAGEGIRIYDEGGHDKAHAAHIARHDPARVLREVEAKRAIVARFVETDGCYCDAFAHHSDEDVRYLAAIWADHADYREEWAA